ncbi:MAG: biopolymer transporter ExbD [Fibrobacteria bacterium]|nr:biopolymer transporter ExbD [Fibrobacteria bacterium]
MNEFGLKKKIRRSAELNIAPMMDMVFILLIFFIVTTSFTRETGVDVSKPKAASAQTLVKANILIGVTKEGSIHINEGQVSLNVLGSILKRYMAESPERPVIIVADRGAPVANVVDILDECNLAKVKKVSLSAERE